MFDPPTELRVFLSRYEEAVASLALGLRAVVLHELAPCHEYIFEMRSKVVLLYGASERVMADGICNIGVFRQHVTLTFVEGVDLEDPGRLLRGAGATMRHVRITSAADLERPELRTFLRQARALANQSAGPSAGTSGRREQAWGHVQDGVTTRVKPRSVKSVADRPTPRR
jgi:hypothetical protein